MSEPRGIQTVALGQVKGELASFDGPTNLHIHGGNHYNTSGNSTFNYTTIYQEVHTAIAGGTDTVTQDEVAKIIEMLKEYADAEFWEIHRDIVEKRIPKTGDVFLKTKKVREWIKVHGSILWATGGPGAGKTYLSSAMYEFLESISKASDDTAIAIAYLRYTERLTAWDVIMSLIVQLVECKPLPSVLDIVSREFAEFRQRNRRPSLAELSHILRSILKRFGRCYLVIDGLDEMGAEFQALFLEIMAGLEANIFLTSREMKMLKDRLNEMSAQKPVFVTVAAQEEDLELFIAQAIERSPHLAQLLQSSQKKEEVVAKVKQKAAGMFLHAVLHIEALKQCLDIEELLNTLEQFPAGIEALYEETIRRIERQPALHAARAKLALTWLLHADGVLSIDDLLQAVAMLPPDYGFKATRTISEDTLIDICCGLITVDRESRQARLVHLTAQGPLREILQKDQPHPNYMMARSCMSRLVECGFQNFQPDTLGDVLRCIAQHPLLQYSYRFLLHHIQLGVEERPDLLPLVHQFVRQCSSFPYFNPLTTQKRDHSTRIHKLGPLHVASLLNLPELVVELLRSDKTVVNIPASRGQDGRSDGWTSLMIACWEGNERVVEALRSAPLVNVNAVDDSGMSALMIASKRGFDTIVDHILRLSQPSNPKPKRQTLRLSKLFGLPEKDTPSPSSPMVNQQDRAGRSALIHAALNGHDRVVRALLASSDLDVNLQERDGWTPLILAAQYGHEDVVRALIAVPWTKPNLPNHNGHSPLMYAVSNGHTGVVKILLADWRVSHSIAQSYQESTLLTIAARKGHEDIVQLLLQSPRTDINARDGQGSAAIMLAMQNRHYGIMKLLLRRPQIKVNQVSQGMTLLILATQSGLEDIVALLLKTPTLNVNQEGYGGYTALMVACDGGQQGVVGKLLSAKGIDVNRTSEDGMSALICASKGGYDGIVAMLLAVPGIDLQHKSNAGWSALKAASRNGHEPVIKLLIAAQENVKQKAADAMSPLLIAAKFGHRDVVKALLAEPNVNVNEQDFEGRTALMHAVQGGFEGIFNLLLHSSGIDINHRDKFGWTALMVAVQFGGKHIVKQILAAAGGTLDPNQRTMDGKSALLTAIQHQLHETTHALLAIPNIDVTIEDSEGNTPMTWAMKHGDEQLVQKLARLGAKQHMLGMYHVDTDS